MQHEACVKRVGRQETQTKRRQKSGSVKIKAQSNQSSQIIGSTEIGEQIRLD